MQRYSLFTLLIVAVTTASLGFSIARIMPNTTTTPSTANLQTNAITDISIHASSASSIAYQTQIGSTSGKPAVLSEKEWFAKALALDLTHPNPNVINELVLALQAEPILRYQLMKRFGIESDSRTKQVIISALGSSPTDDVVDFSMQLIASSDAAEKKIGFELLAAMPPTSATHQAVKKILEQEHNPEVLQEAIAAMMPSMKIAPTEAQATISQLGDLTQHDNSSVRARSLEMLALWDKTGKTLEGIASQAFNDTAPEVRRAAINATMLGQLRSDKLKTNLMSVLSNVNEEREMKMGALQALEHFALNNDEYITYNRVRQEVAGMHFDVSLEKAKN
jgi:hypothetical protein